MSSKAVRLKNTPSFPKRQLNNVMEIDRHKEHHGLIACWPLGLQKKSLRETIDKI